MAAFAQVSSSEQTIKTDFRYKHKWNESDKKQ